ncbi:MAG: hypothetical protein Kow00121_34630 [Elainellaceae cyanobacterium]
MDSSVSLSAALCLSNADIEALIQGRMIATLSRTFINSIQSFALCPVDDASDRATVKIQAWAKFEFCRMYRDSQDLEKLSKLTIWSDEFLQDLLKERHKIFLACLRVYQLSQPIELSGDRIHPSKIGSFIKLPCLLSASKVEPVLSEATFQKRQQQLIKLEPPLHPELEKFQLTVSQFISNNPLAQELEQDIKSFLGWTSSSFYKRVDSDIAWIQTIAEVGNSPDGYKFEKLVRKSLVKLGFSNSLNNPKASLDPEGMGGAGGLDVYCDAPYSLVGECKATKHETVSNSVSAQLIHLGNTHLGTEQFEGAIKVLFVAGKLTDPAQLAALGNRMNVIRPETLQKLVELKSQYPGSINLLELKPCLEQAPFGEQADEKINRFIERVRQQIKLRSDLVKSVKLLTRPDRTQLEVVEICTCYNLKFASSSSYELSNMGVYELLLELSSPLTGYLGRIQGRELQSDRFYYLRDLTIEE